MFDDSPGLPAVPLVWGHAMTDTNATPVQALPEFTVDEMEDTLILDDTHPDGSREVTTGYIPELHEYGDGECGSMSVARAERIAAVWNMTRSIPDPAAALKRLVEAADGMYAATPEQKEYMDVLRAALAPFAHLIGGE